MTNTILIVLALLAQGGFAESLSDPNELADEPSSSDQDNSAFSGNLNHITGDYLSAVTDNIVKENGPEIAKELLDAGYSQENLQQLTKDLAADLGSCLLNAIAVQAAEQSLDVEPYVRFFAIGSGGPKEIELLEKLDMEAAMAKWKPCINRARIGRGLQPVA